MQNKHDPQTIRLLCTADLHLGRKITQLPDELHADQYAPACAWKALIEYAISHTSGIDAILISGDVVDREDRFFEAYRPLEQGIRQLLEAKIPVIAIAGNHDAKVFRKLKQAITSEQFYLLGATGLWESKTLILKGRPIRFDGWSFSETHAPKNPFDEYHLALSPPLSNEIAVGLLHCDCPGSKGSQYAPVNNKDFLALPHIVWVLGHIHKPAVLHADPLIFYCGSPQGLDPSESGLHGARIVEIQSTGEVRHYMLPLAALRWEAQTLSLQRTYEEEIESSITTALTMIHERLTVAEKFLRAVACRLTFEGKTSAFRKIPALLNEMKGKVIASKANGEGGEIVYFIESANNCTLPDCDLLKVSEGSDPPALLAQQLLLIQSKVATSKQKQLLSDAQRHLNEMKCKHPFFGSGEISDVTEEQTRDYLLRAGFYALDQLLAQKESGNET